MKSKHVLNIFSDSKSATVTIGFNTLTNQTEFSFECPAKPGLNVNESANIHKLVETLVLFTQSIADYSAKISPVLISMLKNTFTEELVFRKTSLEKWLNERPIIFEEKEAFEVWQQSKNSIEPNRVMHYPDVVVTTA